VLLASLIGSYFNIPLTELPEREVRSGQVIEFFGMRYIVPLVTDWPRTVIAVNIGGAVIPTLLSLYLLVKNWIWNSAALATLVVAIACSISPTGAGRRDCHPFSCPSNHCRNHSSARSTQKCGGGRLCQRKSRYAHWRRSIQSQQDSGTGSSRHVDRRSRYL